MYLSIPDIEDGSVLGRTKHDDQVAFPLSQNWLGVTIEFNLLAALEDLPHGGVRGVKRATI